MFSDFENHVAGVPQIAPPFGSRTSNMIYDGPGEDEDFGAMQITGDPADRYKFRTSPLRNIAPRAGVLPQRRVRAAGRCDSFPPRSDAAATTRRAAGIDRDLIAQNGTAHRRVVLLDPMFRNGGIDLSESGDSRRHAVRQDRAARSARGEREPVRPDSENRAQRAPCADVRGCQKKPGKRQGLAIRD